MGCEIFTFFLEGLNDCKIEKWQIWKSVTRPIKQTCVVAIDFCLYHFELVRYSWHCKTLSDHTADY